MERNTNRIAIYGAMAAAVYTSLDSTMIFRSKEVKLKQHGLDGPDYADGSKGKGSGGSNRSIIDLAMQTGKIDPPKDHMNTRTKPQKKELGRNDICTCGSGKKYKKCCNGHPPRFK